MSIRMSIRATIATAMLLVTRVAAGQSAAEHIALGDKEYVARNLVAAMQQYEAAVAADSSIVEALWKASNAAVDLGEFNDAERQSYYARGEELGRLRGEGRSEFGECALSPLRKPLAGSRSPRESATR